MATNFGPASLASQTSLLQANEDRVLHGLKQNAAHLEDGKIEKGAQQFEAMLLSTWMQQAEQSMATVPGADDDDEDAAGREQMMSLGVQSVTTSLADSGGIGIGRMIAQAMRARLEQSPTEAIDNKQNASKVPTAK